jgi:hypothetical protein
MATVRIEEADVAAGIARARALVGRAPLRLLLPLTALAVVLTLPLGLILPPLLWLARDSWRYERKVAELYGPGSEELDQTS